MRENSLLLIMDLFALIGKSDSPYRVPRRKMEEIFLKQTIKDDRVDSYLHRHDQILAEQLSLSERKQRISTICHELNSALTKRQRANAALRIMEYTLIALPYDQDEYDTLKMLSGELKLSSDEFELMQGLIESSENFQGPNALIISSENQLDAGPLKHMTRQDLEGVIHMAYIKSADMYFARYEGLGGVQLNGVRLKKNAIHVFSPGSIIRGELIKPVYYSDVVSCFRLQDAKHKLDFKVDKVTYNFPDGPVGLHELSFTEYTGQLMGIMGGSGSGKSTLLNVLNGSIRPTTGKITVNGIDLYDQANELKGVVGFVSQDDLLIENLTVYQNLYFNAQLCFSGKDEDFVREKVEKVSLDLGLNKIRHLKVGNPLEKIISGGQRKRLNIALELIREPAVLFLDEPTSGLSSKDSEVIIDLLKSLALRGTLVFMVIHQPSSQIFKVLDKLLLLDQGGYPVYFGNPVDSVIYFKHATHQINPDMGECVCCGNVNPEQIFSIMEVKQLDESGFPTGERRFAPKQWNEHFIQQQALQEPAPQKTASAFVNDYRKPGLLKQFSVFVKRDVLAKLNNQQYLFITLLEAPVLAFLLAFLTRYRMPGQEYSFQENRNMVSYIFMSVIVALFLGMMVSAQEILSDRKIRKRERFLNLSRAAYLSSKYAILCGIAMIQAFLYVVVGNMIMGFRENYFEFWLMFFVLMLYANALGLNVSSAFRSAVTIYILIPFLIIPQLMLSGLLVKFDELNPMMSKRSVVPISGDMMATRWAFEGLAVQLYTENDYKDRFYELDKQKMNLLYYKTSWFYKMNEIIKATNSSTADSLLPLIKTEFESVGLSNKYATIAAVEKGESMNVLLSVRKTFNDRYDLVLEKLDATFLKTNADGTKQDWEKLRSLYFNDRLEDLVTNRDLLTDKIYFEDGSLHSGTNSIYFDPPEGQHIRAHLFAPRKYIFGHYFSTYWINICVILLMTFVLHVLLYFRVAEHFVNRLGNISLFAKYFKKE
jgi:ABC-type multidrug transport system ATPase subunit